MIWKLQTFFSAHDLYYKFFQIRNSLHVSIIQLILECSMSSDCFIMWRLLMSSDCCIMRKHLMSSDCCICSTFMVAYLLIVCFTHRSSSVPLMAADVTTCPTPGEAKCMSWWIAPTSCGGVWIIDLSMVLWSICNQSSLCHFNNLNLYFWFIIHWWFHKVRIKSATVTDVNSRGYIWNNWLLEINMLIEGCIFLSIQ